MEFIYLALGLTILLGAGDCLVKGAVNTALRLGVPALIVSLTIVAFGTSAPELLVSIQSIWDGVPGLALGNVVGSNTANILLVLGVPAILAGMKTGECEMRNSYLQMLAGSVLFIGLCFFKLLTWWSGLLLLTALAAMLAQAAREMKAHRAQDTDDIEGADPTIGWPRILLFLLIGLVGLPIGAQLLIHSATAIADDFGLSEEIIGLTIVAIGTSLPELATTVMASLRKQTDVAIGNVIGSNMFNLLGIIGIASLVGDIPVGQHFLQLDLWVMLASSLALAPFVFSRRDITRGWGILLTLSYIAYLVFIVARPH